MSELSNTYRDQVRELLRRRIREARERLRDEKKGKVEAARRKAAAQPAIVAWSRSSSRCRPKLFRGCGSASAHRRRASAPPGPPD